MAKAPTRLIGRALLLALPLSALSLPHLWGVAQEGGRGATIVAGRVEHLERWDRLDPSLTGVERFAHFVQMVVDDAQVRVSDPASPLYGIDGRQLFLDDLADLMVDDSFLWEKGLVMETEPALLGRVLVETVADLESFRPELRVGDGRFRHFALSAVAAYRLPGFLVAWAARVVGNDTDTGAGLSSHGEADLLTNEIGREFASFVRSRSLAELADGSSVAAWLLAYFAPV